MPLSSINIYTLKQIRTKRHRYDLEEYPITIGTGSFDQVHIEPRECLLISLNKSS